MAQAKVSVEQSVLAFAERRRRVLPMTTCTVLICTYSDERLSMVRQAVRAVQGQEPAPDEVLVVVDHNHHLAEVLASDTTIRVVANEEARGLSGARNTGLRAALGTIVVFLDDDAEPRPGWLAELLQPFEEAAVSGVGGFAAPRWQSERPSWLPPEFDWVVGCSYTGQETGIVRNPIGCNMAFRREVLIDVGGFANGLGRVGTIPLGCEETELGLRVNQAGGRVVLVPGASVDHFVPDSRARFSYFVRRCFAEGLSKAEVARLAKAMGISTGQVTLGPERRYLRALGKGFTVNVRRARSERSFAPLAQAGAIPVGLAVTTVGFLLAKSGLTRRL